MGVGAGLYMYDVVVVKFTFAISFPDEFLYCVVLHCNSSPVDCLQVSVISYDTHSLAGRCTGLISSLNGTRSCGPGICRMQPVSFRGQRS